MSEPSFRAERASQGSEQRYLLGGKEPGTGGCTLLIPHKHGFTGVSQEGQGVRELDGLQSLP